MSNYLDRYEIIDEIGSGGFSTVYLARDPLLDRSVAVKVMRPLLMSDPDFVNRFRREAKVAANLQHPNIVPIYDRGEFEGRLFLVMKLMDTSLGKRLEKGPLDWSAAVEMASQVATGLSFAHANKVIHRDIEPDNVLLDDRTGTANLADFGIVKALGRTTLTLSLSQGVLGTPAYIAPEIWNGEAASPASDIYALACVIFEMVTGEKLFEGATPPATMTLHFRPPQFPQEWPQGVPSEFASALARALAQEPAERYESAQAFAEALGALDPDPLAEAYTALKEAMAGERWTTALELAETILIQDNHYKDVTTLLEQAVQGKTAEDQAKLVVGWREQAETALANKEWDTAIVAAQQWLRLAPGSEAQAVLTQAQDGQAGEVVRVVPVTIEREKEDEPTKREEPLVKDAEEPVTEPEINERDIAATAGVIDRRWLAAGIVVAGLVIIAVIFSLTTGVFQGGEADEVAALTADSEAIAAETQAPSEQPAPTDTPLPTDTPDPIATAEAAFETFNEYKENGNSGAAYTWIVKAIEDNPENASYYYERAKLNREFDRAYLALEDIENAISMEPDNIAYYAQRGAIYRQSGDLDAALDDLVYAGEMEPDNVETQLELVYIHEALGDVDSAIEAYSTIIGLEPNNDSHYKARADLHWQQGDYESAVTDLETTISINPDVRQYYDDLGSIYLNDLEENENAVGTFSKAIERWPSGSWYFAMRAQSYENMDDLEAALADINQAIDIYSSDPWYYGLRAEIYRNAGKYEEAIADMTSSINRNSENAHSYAQRGQIYFYDLEDLDSALDDFDKAIELGPTYVYMYIDRANLFNRLGNGEAALADLDQAINLDDEYYEIYVTRGDTYRDVFQDSEAALAEYETAIELSSTPQEQANVLRSRVNLYHYILGDYNAALADMNQAISLDSGDPWNYRQRAYIYRELGDADAALADFDSAIALNTNSRYMADNYIGKGGIYQDLLGDLDAALLEFEKAVEIDPDYGHAYIEMGSLYLFHLDDPDTALSYINQGIELDPEDKNGFDSRAFLYNGLGSYEAAEADWGRCIELDPEYWWCYHHRGWLHDSLGDTESAVADFRLYLEYVPENDCLDCQESVTQYIQDHGG